MLFTITLLLILCIVLLVIKYRKKNRNYWKERGVLQIDDLTWTYLFGKQSMPEICKSIYDKYDTPHIGTTMASTPTLILKDLEDIKAVLDGDYEAFLSRGVATNPNDVLADNLLFIDDYRKWKLVRHTVGFIFSHVCLKEIFYIIENCARDFVELVEDNRHLRQNPFKVLYTYTTASIASVIFGIETQFRSSTMYTPFLEMTWKSVKPSWLTKIQVFIATVCPYLFKKLKLKHFGEHEKFFLGFVKKVLRSKRQQLIRNLDFISTSAGLQNIGMMQDFSTSYELCPTDELFAAQAFALFIAGSDTTANTLHFTLMEICNDRKMFDKLQREVDGVFGKYKEELAFPDIEKLRYLDMVVKESLRKYPPIGFVQRICTKETVLPTQVKIEKGTFVVIPIFAIHRDEKYYSNPEVFDPERFKLDNASNIKKFTYMPFGEGHRICLGRKFARLQIKTVLAWILRRFIFDEQKCTPNFEKSAFALRSPETRYLLVPRDDLPAMS